MGPVGPWAPAEPAFPDTSERRRDSCRIWASALFSRSEIEAPPADFFFALVFPAFFFGFALRLATFFLALRLATFFLAVRFFATFFAPRFFVGFFLARLFDFDFFAARATCYSSS